MQRRRRVLTPLALALALGFSGLLGAPRPAVAAPATRTGGAFSAPRPAVAAPATRTGGAFSAPRPAGVVPAARPAGVVPAARPAVAAPATHQAGAARATRRRVGGHRSHKKAHRPPQVTLAPGAGAGVQVSMPPVGLSFEYPVMAADLGAGPCPAPAFVAELQQLGSPPLALAGASQDLTAPSGALSGAAPSWETATLYSLPAAFWSQLHCLLSATKEPLTVGLNVKSGQLAWASQMVAGAQSAATAGLDFSLGNEPDLYYLPNYSALDKPQSGEEAIAVGLYLQVASYIQQALAGQPVIGPELARPARWQAQLPRVIAALHEQTVGVHMYPLSACSTPRAVTLRGLLSAKAANAPRRLAWVVADAGAAGLPAIVSEANSASCGGREGVSNSPAAAVWAVRFVLSALKTGFREVRFHFSGNAYDPFLVRGEQIVARPLQSALAALYRWLPVGASLRSVAGPRGLVDTSVATPSGGTLTILDNERARARRVLLRGADSVRMEALGAARAGVQTRTLSSPHARIALVLAPNSVVALTPSPAPTPSPSPTPAPTPSPSPTPAPSPSPTPAPSPSA
jgi:hypothetical protein